MIYVRLVLGIIAGMLIITIVAEGIEFLLVKAISGKSFEYLKSNHNEYFSIRNNNWVLVSKAFYSLIAGLIGGYLATWISREMAKTVIYILILIQIASLVWGGFVSDLSETGPTWMWICLILVIPFGIWIGYKWKSKGSVPKI